MAENKDKKVLNVPHLRFPEFTEEWDTYIIADILCIGNGRDYKHLSKGNIPVFGTGGYMTSVNECLYEGETTFIGRKGTINKPFYYNGKFWTVDTLFYTHSFKRVIPEFVYCLFQTINWLRYNEASGVPSLSKDTIEKIKVRIPQLDEQKKIAKLLSLLDERIAAQNKIIEKLQSLIKGLVDELMGVLLKGKLYPFSSFYIKAGEGGTPTTSVVEYYTEGTIPFIKIEDLSCKYLTKNKDFITELGMQKSSAWLIPSKSVIYSNGATIGAISINEYPVCTKQGILGIIPNTNINVEYLYLLMSSSYFSKEISRIITEGTMKTAYLRDINHIKCPLPSMAQQKNITNLTSSIEEKLSIEQELLRFLNLQKQYLLRMMFI